MNRIREERGLAVSCVFAVLVCFLAAVSVHGTEQAAPAAAGLERHQKAGLTCKSCHKEEPPKTVVPGDQCMTCHGDLAKLIQKSSKAVPNPHASPHINPGEQPKCEDCHHIHKPSEISCLNCHQDFKYKMP
ncbi:MAG: cytochrome c3 family protein [Syntrophaceae bacterium]|nr:cytochrome c3 family protein [Syntrophaceae bacterium]